MYIDVPSAPASQMRRIYPLTAIMRIVRIEPISQRGYHPHLSAAGCGCRIAHYYSGSHPRDLDYSLLAAAAAAAVATAA